MRRSRWCGGIQGSQLAVEIGLHASAAVARTDGNRICRFAFGGKNAWVKMRAVPKRDKCDRGRVQAQWSYQDIPRCPQWVSVYFSKAGVG